MRNNQLNVAMKKGLQRIKNKKEIFGKLANRRMEEIKYISKQIDFSNLTYRYKGNNDKKVLKVIKVYYVFIKT